MRTASLIFTSIIVFLSWNGFAQVTQQRQLPSFTGISLDTFADVYITAGDKTTVVVKADEPVIDQVITEVNNGVLHISTEGRIHRVEVMDVYVTMPKIDLLKLSGSGDVSCSGAIQANGLKIEVEGSGDVGVDVDEAKNVEVSVSGSGDVSLQRVSGRFSASISGSGDLEVDHVQVEKCILSLAGSGDIELEGSCVNLAVSVEGSGDIDAGGLKAVDADIEISGSGDCAVLVANSLNAVLNGSGDLTYHGSPVKVNVAANGSGEVYRR